MLWLLWWPVSHQGEIKGGEHLHDFTRIARAMTALWPLYLVVWLIGVPGLHVWGETADLVALTAVDVVTNVGVGIFNAEGVCCYGTNTSLEELAPERLSGAAEATFAIESLDLVEGTYKLDVAVHKRDGFPYDYHRLLYTFRVKSRTQDIGVYRPRHRWTFTGDVSFGAANRT